MRHLFYLCILIFSLAIVSCGDDDPCEDLNCNSGTCNEGICQCDEGFEGTNCDTEIRAKYLGIWIGPNMCNDNAFVPVEIDTVSLEITEDENDINSIVITLVIDAGFTELDIPGESTTLIGNAFETGPTETVLGTFPLLISSDGIFRSDSELSLDFDVTVEIPTLGEQTISCSADLFKQ